MIKPIFKKLIFFKSKIITIFLNRIIVDSYGYSAYKSIKVKLLKKSLWDILYLI